MFGRLLQKRLKLCIPLPYLSILLCELRCIVWTAKLTIYCKHFFISRQGINFFLRIFSRIRKIAKDKTERIRRTSLTTENENLKQYSSVVKGKADNIIASAVSQMMSTTTRTLSTWYQSSIETKKIR